jgi:heptosyltransferase-1/heptosyltransferase-2
MSSLGDVIHTLPFVAVLRRRFPQARITWLVHPQFAAFLPDKPLVDQVSVF